MGWATEDLWFNFLQGQEMFLFYKAFISDFEKNSVSPFSIMGDLAPGAKRSGHEEEQIYTYIYTIYIYIYTSVV